jgi:hypothetical protein
MQLTCVSFASCLRLVCVDPSCNLFAFSSPSISSIRVMIDCLARELDCTPVCAIRLILCHEMALDPRIA